MIFFRRNCSTNPSLDNCVQSTKCHFDEVTFRRNGSLDEVSFDEVSHFEVVMSVKTCNQLMSVYKLINIEVAMSVKYPIN